MFYVKQLINQAGRRNSSRIFKTSWQCRVAVWICRYLCIRRLSGRNILFKDKNSEIESNKVMENNVLCSYQRELLKILSVFIRQWTYYRCHGQGLWHVRTLRVCGERRLSPRGSRSHSKQQMVLLVTIISAAAMQCSDKCSFLLARCLVQHSLPCQWWVFRHHFLMAQVGLGSCPLLVFYHCFVQFFTEWLWIWQCMTKLYVIFSKPIISKRHSPFNGKIFQMT